MRNLHGPTVRSVEGCEKCARCFVIILRGLPENILASCHRKNWVTFCTGSRESLVGELCGLSWAKRDAEGEEVPLDNVCPRRRAASYGRGHFSLRPISDALSTPRLLRCFLPG